MNFKADFIQVCFQFSADYIQPFFHLFFDVVNSWSVMINRVLLSLFFDLHCGSVHGCMIYILDAHACRIYVHELKIKLLKSKFECCPVSSCNRSCTLVPWNSDEFLSR